MLVGVHVPMHVCRYRGTLPNVAENYIWQGWCVPLSRVKTCALTRRNLCIHRGEAVRKCNEDVDKNFVQCMARAGADGVRCGAQNATVLSSCTAKEIPKRTDCKVRKKTLKKRKKGFAAGGC